MYSESQNTSGMETAIQRTVRFEAVWHQEDSPTSAGAGGAGGAATAMVSAATSRALLAARRAKERAVGDLRSGELVGAGDAVEVREDFLVGEGSNVGKLPRGVWRVETILN